MWVGGTSDEVRRKYRSPYNGQRVPVKNVDTKAFVDSRIPKLYTNKYFFDFRKGGEGIGSRNLGFKTKQKRSIGRGTQPVRLKRILRRGHWGTAAAATSGNSFIPESDHVRSSLCPIKSSRSVSLSQLLNFQRYSRCRASRSSSWRSAAPYRVSESEPALGLIRVQRRTGFARCRTRGRSASDVSRLADGPADRSLDFSPRWRLSSFGALSMWRLDGSR